MKEEELVGKFYLVLGGVIDILRSASSRKSDAVRTLAGRAHGAKA